MLEIPQTKKELELLGYVLKNPTRCKGCFIPIDWWLTPRGIFVPFEWDLDGGVKLHYLSCETMTQACHERLEQYGTEL